MSYDRGRGPPNIKGMTSLKVDNLTYRTTVEDLKRVFQKYGDVGDVYIPRDARTNQSRGFAFVRFYDRRDAEEAMDRVDGSELDGREIRVQHAKYGRPQTEYRQRSGRDRDRGYSDRRGRRSYSPRPRRSRSRSRSYSPKRSRSRSPQSKRSRSPPSKRSRSPPSKRSRSHSPRRRQSRSPQQERRRGEGSTSPKRASQSPERNGSPTRNRKSSSPEKSS